MLRVVDFDPRVGQGVQAVPAVFPQATLEQTPDAVGVPAGSDSSPVGLEDRAEQVGDAVALKGSAAGEHLVDHAPESPDVAALVRRQPLRLLGRHVRRCAENGPDASSRPRPCSGRLSESRGPAS
jgi:hypothetical protein